MLSSVFSAGISGIDGFLVTVECDSRQKKFAFEIVGLPDTAIKEAKERVRTACDNTGIRFPNLCHTINLAPADRRKEGSAFDVGTLNIYKDIYYALTEGKPMRVVPEMAAQVIGIIETVHAQNPLPLKY